MLNQKLAKGEVFPGEEAQCSRASHTKESVIPSRNSKCAWCPRSCECMFGSDKGGWIEGSGKTMTTLICSEAGTLS